jgi:hypothetical protein
MSSTSMLKKVNTLLPADMRVDEKHVERFKKRKCSEVLVGHVVLDRVEARLRALDSVKAGRYVRDWKETWAAPLLAEPGFDFFQQRYESTAEQRDARRVLVARGADAADAM